MLKERTIGIEVFGRPTSYDPSDDATVRVKAGEVRKRLGLYYSDHGAHNPLRIELPSGAYVPDFMQSNWRRSSRKLPERPAAEPAAPALAAATPWRIRAIWGAAGGGHRMCSRSGLLAHLATRIDRA